MVRDLMEKSDIGTFQKKSANDKRTWLCIVEIKSNIVVCVLLQNAIPEWRAFIVNEQIRLIINQLYIN